MQCEYTEINKYLKKKQQAQELAAVVGGRELYLTPHGDYSEERCSMFWLKQLPQSAREELTDRAGDALGKGLELVSQKG